MEICKKSKRDLIWLLKQWLKTWKHSAPYLDHIFCALILVSIACSLNFQKDAENTANRLLWISIMSILVCTKYCDICLTQLKHFLILLCKPVCELLMLAIWLMYVGVLRKLEMNILNLFEEVLLSFLNGERDKSRTCSPVQIGNFSLVPLCNTLKINGMQALHEVWH